MSSRELYFSVLGQSGTGKTTLLSSMYKQFERVLPGGFFPRGKETFTALNTAWKQLITSATDLSPEFSSAIQGTEDLREYTFTLKGKSEEADVTFYDFPGGWMNPYDEAQADNFSRVVDIVRKSSAIIVAVNTPCLMEEDGRYRDKAAIDEIEYILRTSFSEEAAAKLIAIVPIKCEKYTRTPEGVNALHERVSKEFASTFGLMDNPAYSGRLSVEVIPVQTAGNAEFMEFMIQDGQVRGEVYRKVPGMPFTQKDADTLLRRITEHLEDSLKPPVPVVVEQEFTAMPRPVERKPSRPKFRLTAAVWTVLVVGMFVCSYKYSTSSERLSRERQRSEEYSREVEELKGRVRIVEAAKSEAERRAAEVKSRDVAELEELRAEIERLEKAEAESPENLLERGHYAYYISNDVEALELFRKSAEKGNAEAENMLGVMYYTGRGVSEDKVLAREYARKSAIHGSAAGQNNYAYLLQLEEKHVEARVYYEMAAEQGNISAMTSLGAIYFFGRGVSQDYAVSFEWSMKAALSGDVTAQCNVAYAYKEGYGVARDWAKAREWYEKAAAQDDEDAKKALEALELNGSITHNDFTRMCGWTASAFRSELERLRVSPNYRFSYGDKPSLLMVAAGYSDTSPEVIKTLIDMGADVNAQDNDGWTALIWAVRINTGYRKTQIIRILLDNGAKVIVNGKNAIDFTNDYAITNLLRQYQ